MQKATFISVLVACVWVVLTFSQIPSGGGTPSVAQVITVTDPGIDIASINDGVCSATEVATLPGAVECEPYLSLTHF